MQVAERVRVDDRLTIMERTNLRYISLKDMPSRQRVQLATLDLSFISVLKVLPAVCSVLDPDGAVIVLIKPQFEAGRSEVRLTCRETLQLQMQNTCLKLGPAEAVAAMSNSVRLMPLKGNIHRVHLL